MTPPMETPTEREAAFLDAIRPYVPDPSLYLVPEYDVERWQVAVSDVLAILSSAKRDDRQGLELDWPPSLLDCAPRIRGSLKIVAGVCLQIANLLSAEKVASMKRELG